jgi:hypothetical protein
MPRDPARTIAIAVTLAVLAGCSHTVETADGPKTCHGTGLSCARLVQKWEQEEFTRKREEAERIAKEETRKRLEETEKEYAIKRQEYRKWEIEHPVEAEYRRNLAERPMRGFLKPNIFGCPGNLMPSSSMPGACR